MTKTKKWMGMFVLLFLTNLRSHAQTPAGQILGQVRDSSHAVMVSVALQVRHRESGVVYNAKTDGNGRYEFLRLPPGNYAIRAQYQAFQPAQAKVIGLNAGQVIRLDLVLQIRASGQTIRVTGKPAPLDLSSAHVSQIVDKISFVTLPINGRSLEQLALLAPGLVPVRAKDNRAVNGFTRKISGNGARGATFLLDGLDIRHASFAEDTPGGVSGLLLGMDSVEEFEILSDAYPAYLGGSGGPVVSIVTRRGTRQFHGSLFEYYRDSALDARNFFDSGEIPPFTRHQFGGSLGGPLPGNGNTLFLGYEGLRERLGRTLFNTVPNEAARSGLLLDRQIQVAEEIRPLLDLYPLPNGRDFGDGSASYSYEQVQPTDDHHLNLRTDFSFSDKDTLFVRYSFQDSRKVAPIELTIEGFDSDLDSRNDYLTLEESHFFSSRLLNTFQIGFNRSRYKSISIAGGNLPGVAPLIEGRRNLGRINVRGLTSIGTETADLAFRMNQLEVSDSLRFAAGKHDLRMGFNWKNYRSDGFYDVFFDGLLIYENLGSFLTNSPQRFLGAEPGSDARKAYRQDFFSLYVHDQLRWNSQLAISYGLRYAWFTVPTERSGRLSNLRRLADEAPTVGEPLFDNPSHWNFAPRVGLAWNVGGRDRTVVRSAFGIFYEPIRENIFGFGARLQPPFITVRTLIRPPFPNPFDGRIRGKPRTDPIEFGLSTPYVMRYHLTLQQALSDNLLLRIGYVGSRGVHLPRVGDINTPAPQSAGPEGRPFFGTAAGPRRNPNFDLIRYTSTDANSVYNSLQVGLRRRWESGLQFDFNYTYGRSIDDASGYRRQFTNSIADVPPDYYNRSADRGLSNFHISHHAVLQYTWDLPFRSEGGGLWALLASGWQTAGILSLSSGYPFTANVSFDVANNRVREGHRPDLAPGADNNPVLGGPDRYFDVSAFKLQQRGYLGNLGRNTLIGPGYASLDMAACRRLSLSDGQVLTLRFEVFNLLNRSNFAAPQNSLTGGVILFNNPSGVPVGNAATIFSTVGSSRQLQLGLRWAF